jgi:hypothetical protein
MRCAVRATGVTGLETDGQFEGIACADPAHDHNGLAGGWSGGLQAVASRAPPPFYRVAVSTFPIWQATLDFNVALKALIA